MEQDDLRDAISGTMPAVSRKLAGNDWAAAFRILKALGERLEEPDPEHYAWNAFRGLEGRAQWLWTTLLDADTAIYPNADLDARWMT